MLIDMVCPHPAIPLASDLLLPLLPDEEPSIDKAIELAENLKQKRGIYVNPSFLLDVWMKKTDHNKEV